MTYIQGSPFDRIQIMPWKVDHPHPEPSKFVRPDLSRYQLPIPAVKAEPTLDDELDNTIGTVADLVSKIIVLHTLEDGNITEDGRELLLDLIDRLDKVLDVAEEAAGDYGDIIVDDLPDDMTDRP